MNSAKRKEVAKQIALVATDYMNDPDNMVIKAEMFDLFYRLGEDRTREDLKEEVRTLRGTIHHLDGYLARLGVPQRDREIQLVEKEAKCHDCGTGCRLSLMPWQSEPEVVRCFDCAKKIVDAPKEIERLKEGIMQHISDLSYVDSGCDPCDVANVAREELQGLLGIDVGQPKRSVVFQNECRLVIDEESPGVIVGRSSLTWDNGSEVQVDVREIKSTAHIDRLKGVPVRITIERVPGGNE